MPVRRTTRAAAQVLGTNETTVKYGRLPACWGEVVPSVRWQRELFRAETEDHDSPGGRGGEHLIVNVWRSVVLCAVRFVVLCVCG